MRLLLIAALGSVPLFAQPGQIEPIDWKVRTRLYTHKFVSPQSVMDTAPSYFINHGIDAPKEWNQNAGGFLRRIGSTYAQYATRETIELGMFAVRKEDPRYVREEGAPLRSRIGHVFKSTFYAHNRAGREIVAVNNLMGIVGSRTVANLWLPQAEHAASRVALNSALHLLGKTGSNALREFWPDIWHRFRPKK